TARAAGAVNGTAAEPGPGTRVLVDSGGIITITAAGKLRKSTTSAPTLFTDPRLYYQDTPLTRGAGIVYQSRFTPGATGAQNIFGLRSALTGGSSNIAVGFYAISSTFQAWDGVQGVEIAPLTVNIPYVATCVLDATGARMYLQGGELYRDHTLVWSIDY